MTRGEATVRWARLDEQRDDRFEAVLSADERSRAASLISPRDRSRFVAARAVMRILLGDATGVDPGRIEFAYGERGKPRLAGREEPRFSLSHSHGVMALALCEGREVGIDVEAVRERLSIEKIARRHLPPQVLAGIEAEEGDEPSEAFFRAWVRQEAYAKARGEGLRLIGQSPDPEGWTIVDLDLLGGYAAAVAIEGGAPVAVNVQPASLEAAIR